MKQQMIATSDLAAWQGVDADALIVMPCTDAHMAQRAAVLMSERAAAPGCLLMVLDEAGWGFIRIVNAVFNQSGGRHFGYVAQDAFAGRLWLQLAIDALRQPGKSLFAFNDGKWHGALAAFGLAQRDWAAANYPTGSFFYEGYRRHYADAELSMLALQQRGYIYDPRSVLVEVDWAKDHKQVDPQDRALYRLRAAQGFDGRVHASELRQMVT